MGALLTHLFENQKQFSQFPRGEFQDGHRFKIQHQLQTEHKTPSYSRGYNILESVVPPTLTVPEHHMTEGTYTGVTSNATNYTPPH